MGNPIPITLPFLLMFLTQSNCLFRMVTRVVVWLITVNQVKLSEEFLCHKVVHS